MRVDAPDGILSMHDQLRDLGRALAGWATAKDAVGTGEGKRVHIGNTSASQLRLMGKVCYIPEVEIHCEYDAMLLKKN